jgi:pimeloyl-ACP methyl ester carboxylesterase
MGIRTNSRLTLTLQDLAKDVEAVIAQIHAQHGINDFVPVSLSYSGAVSPLLKNFPVIIETVPMTSSDATNPQLGQYRRTLRSAELFNPFFGPTITRNSLDAAYRPNWTAQVDSTIGNFNLPADHKSDMVEGYLSMSRASEGFEWSAADLPKTTRRVFIVAGNEGSALLKNQLETFQRLQMSKLLVLIEESGHIIPNEHPALYAYVISEILSAQNAEVSGLIVVTPSTGKIQHLTGADAQKAIADRLAKIN